MMYYVCLLNNLVFRGESCGSGSGWAVTAKAKFKFFLYIYFQSLVRDVSETAMDRYLGEVALI